MHLRPRTAHETFVLVQIFAVTATLTLGALSYAITYYTGHDYIFGIIPYFDVAREDSFPTFLSSVNLLVAAVLCALIFKIATIQGEQPSKYWLILAGIMIFLAIDEATMIHEKLEVLRGLFPETDVINPRHDWLFAGSVLAVVLGLAVVPFLFKLRRKLAIWFVVAGCIYFFGIIGMEFVGSVMLNHGTHLNDLSYLVRRIIEEGCEMYGIVIFNCASSNELARRMVNLKIVAAV